MKLIPRLLDPRYWRLLLYLPVWMVMRLMSDKTYACPVCNYPGFDEDPLAHTFDICPQCGVEFGYDDAGTEHRVLRSRWERAGKPYWRALSDRQKELYMEILHPLVEQDLLSDALAALAAILLTRQRSPLELSAIFACLRDNGAGALAEVIIGRLPFDDGPDYRDLMQ